MMEYVKPNYLGTKQEFFRGFVNPISNGQHENSTAGDVQRMKERAHVLRYKLKDCIQRFDYQRYLKPLLGEKFEYTIHVKLSALQLKLYRQFLDEVIR